ncbi:MAG: AMP-binding protein [Sphingomonadaceae bacterium]|nr:AMP-binding protein [Sphingomonadaceae bacterium]
MFDGTPDSATGLAHISADTSFPLLDMTIGDCLRDKAERFGDRSALIWRMDGELQRFSYSELLAQAELVASWLLERASPGERVAIWSRNSAEWVVTEFACALAGLVVAGWNPAWSERECEHARDLIDPAVLLSGYDTRGVSLMDRAAHLMPSGKVFALEELFDLVRGSKPVELPQVDPSDLFMIQFTSGTTGRSKGASLSHFAALNASYLRAVSAGFDETDIWVNAGPLNHVGGALSVVLGCVSVGSCYVLMQRFETGEYLRMMRETGATRIGGVPTMLIALCEHPEWDPSQFNIRSIGSGGASVPKPLIERLNREFGAPVVVVFGQSESVMITTSVPQDAPEIAAKTSGRAAPHVDLKICHPETGKTLKVGDVGEVCARSPMNMDGYFRMPEATATTIDKDGYIHTGDLGSLDAQGYLSIQGRTREVIIRGGENIYPAEIEGFLLEHPDIVSLAVVPIADEKWGQTVAAAIKLRDGCALDAQELEAFAAKGLAHFKIPRTWLAVEAFPMTASGKIRKVDVEKLFERNSAAPPV